MPKLVATHEVDDVAHWLASPKRAEVFAGIATNLTTYVLPGDSNLVALTMDVEDMDALDTMMKMASRNSWCKDLVCRATYILIF